MFAHFNLVKRKRNYLMGSNNGVICPGLWREVGPHTETGVQIRSIYHRNGLYRHTYETQAWDAA